MRAPLSAIEPISSGVSKVTRGVRASASLRLTTCAGWAARRAGLHRRPGPASGARLAGRRLRRGPFWVDAVCCWLTGGLAGGKAYCQPTMISTESTIATMKFFWSIWSDF